MEIFGHIFSNVSKSLDSYCCALLDVILFCHFEKDIIPSKGGRCFPPEGTSKMYRFSCDDSRILFSGYLIVFVHHPSHDRCIGVDVRSRDILVRADKVCHCFHISPAQMFKLMGRELLWINRNPSLGAAIRDICHSAFECHPECKRLYLILADIWMITDAALCWPEDIIIMDAYRWIDIDGLVIHGDSKVGKKYLFWVLQYFFLVIPQRRCGMTRKKYWSTQKRYFLPTLLSPWMTRPSISIQRYASIIMISSGQQRAASVIIQMSARMR